MAREQDKKKNKTTKEIKKLEDKKKKLMNERESVNIPAKNQKQKNKNEKRAKEIENELNLINAQLDELLKNFQSDEEQEIENTEKIFQDVAKEENEFDLSETDSLVKNAQIDEQDHSKSEFNNGVPGEFQEIQKTFGNNETSENGVNVCKECKRPFTTNSVQKPCELLLVNSQILGSPLLQKSCSKLNERSKTCMNCGNKYNDLKASSNSACSFYSIQNESKLRMKSCCSSMANLGAKKCSQPSYSRTHIQEFPIGTRSKCSQLGHNKSAVSLAPCKSFDQCSTCRKLYFGRQPSCTSFDVCKNCQYSRDSSFRSPYKSQSRDLNARSVIFSLHDDGPDEKILQNIDCDKDLGQKSFGGCDKILNCAVKCPEDDKCDDEMDECDKIRKKLQDLETFVPKEPSQLSMTKSMLQEKLSQQCQRKSEIKQSKIIRAHDPTKPIRHKTRRLIRNELDFLYCPLVPMCISDEKKKRLEQLTTKLIERENRRQTDIKTKKQNKLKDLLKEKCGDDEECKMDSKTCEAPDCVEYSKKYQKMKYEIEVQNFIVEKVNRELQMKIRNDFPDCAINQLKCDLEKEVNKLREMIQFTIFEQCRKRDLKWGSIPISPLTSYSVENFPTTNYIPKTPSEISDISAFSILEDLKLCQEKEKLEQKIEMENNRDEKIRELVEEIQSLECTIEQLKNEHDCLLKRSLANVDVQNTQKISDIQKNQEWNEI